jgi:hypothetical protein
MGQRVKRGGAAPGAAARGEVEANVDHERAALVLPALKDLLGLAREVGTDR